MITETAGKRKLFSFQVANGDQTSRLHDQPAAKNPAGCLFILHFLCVQEEPKKQDFTKTKKGHDSPPFKW